jgi:Lecithin:cholesterol acyltransferase
MAHKPMSDVIVLLPGILGSVLSKGGKDVWGISAGTISSALWSLGDNIKDLAIPANSVDRPDYDDGVTAPRLIPDTHLIPWLWKVDGYSSIADTLRANFEIETGRNYFALPYDWRLDNRVAAKKLQQLSRQWLDSWRQGSGNSNAKLILIAHSMGGLVSRYFLEVLEGWRDTRMLVTFGTPYRGSLNALNFIANGFVKKVGLLKLLDLSAMLRSFTSVYQLLPTYPCYDERGDGKYIYLDKATNIPNLDAARVARAFEFHNEIRNAVERHEKEEEYLRDRYRIHPIVGTYQPTLQSALWNGSTVEVLTEYEGKDKGGDGTVPRVSATPIEMSKAHAEMFVAGQHAALQNADAVLYHLRGLLGDLEIDLDHFKAIPSQNALEIDDAYGTDETITLRARSEVGNELAVKIVNVDTDQEVASAPLERGLGEWQTAEFPPLPEGIYRATVSDVKGAAEPVSDIFAILQN